jgi:hypothetical protein
MTGLTMASYYLQSAYAGIIDPADCNHRKPEDKIPYHSLSQKSIAGKHSIAAEAWT